MIRISFALSLFLLWPVQAWCGELVLQPRQVSNGDVAALQWQGEPLSFGVARFRDEVLYLYPDPSGAVALLPIGLDAPAGDYPLQVALVDKRGQTVSKDLTLRVVHKERPLEALRLPQRMVTPLAKDLKRISRENDKLTKIFSHRSERLWTIFERPVDEEISSVFGKRRTMNGKPRSPHSGTDFRSPAGTPVKALSNGRVVLVDDLFYTGNTVVIDHGEGLFSLYAHLSQTSVEEGYELLGGDVIGKVGSTGRSTGAHLHLTVKLLGERIDPLSLLSLY